MNLTNNDSAFMADATAVLMAYMRKHQIGMDFKHGQLAVGLEIVTLIRTLESLPVVSEAEREGTIATLHTLLREQGLEGAYEAYDRLAEWRKVKFVTAPSQRANGDASVRQRAGQTSSSSVHAALERMTALGGKPRERRGERPSQGQGASPIPGQLELPVEEE